MRKFQFTVNFGAKPSKILFCVRQRENTKKLKSFLCCSSLYIFSLKSLEACNINVGNQGIQFVGRVLVFVTHTCKANSASEGDISEKKYRKCVKMKDSSPIDYDLTRNQ